MSQKIPTVNVTEGFKITSPKYVDPIQSVTANQIPIIEVFYTLEGEGTFIGQPRVLARVGGCLVGCSNCDTKHSWGLDGSQIMTIEDAVGVIHSTANNQTKVVAITGGEPAHYPVQVAAMARQLRKLGYYTWLETSGTTGNNFDLFKEFDFLSFDIKTPSTGVELSPATIDFLRSTRNRKMGHHHVKAVITDMEDLLWIEETFPGLLDNWNNPLILTPAAGPKYSLEKMNEVVNLVLAWNKNYSIRCIAQQHVLLRFR